MIIRNDVNNIYFYHDYTFMIFDKAALLGGADIVGYSWAAGKIPKGSDFNNCIYSTKKGTCYHNILIAELIKTPTEIKEK